MWFRNDLRLSDNPALSAALKTAHPIIPLYIHAPEEAAPWQPGAASNWWLHHSLLSLSQSLNGRGSYLLLKTGNCLEVLRRLVEQTGASGVFWNRLYEPALIKRDTQIKNTLKANGIDCQSFNGLLLQEPHTIINKAGSPFKVFSAYWRKASDKIHELETPLQAPCKVRSPKLSGGNLSVDNLNLLPSIKWYQSFSNSWQPGENGAIDCLERFIESRLIGYKTNRDIPAVEGTSRLSPHLHFGEISPRQAVFILQQAAMSSSSTTANIEKFFSELGWREFGYYLLFHFPESIEKSLDSRFDRFGWIDSAAQTELLRQWQQGNTGIPIVDAGMRELWQTGWMHNRVRMICASILTKNMGFHWLEGARWFWDTLVDADLAANTLGWQWTAGCGVDAAPYFRIFSPSRQAERFDPQGQYIKQWIPELSGADKAVLYNGLAHSSANIQYPLPVIDLAASRKSALYRWDIIRHTDRESQTIARS